MIKTIKIIKHKMKKILFHHWYLIQSDYKKEVVQTNKYNDWLTSFSSIIKQIIMRVRGSNIQVFLFVLFFIKFDQV